MKVVCSVSAMKAECSVSEMKVECSVGNGKLIGLFPDDSSNTQIQVLRTQFKIMPLREQMAVLRRASLQTTLYRLADNLDHYSNDQLRAVSDAAAQLVPVAEAHIQEPVAEAPPVHVPVADVAENPRATAERYAQRYNISVDRAARMLEYCEQMGVNRDRAFQWVLIERAHAIERARAARAARAAAEKKLIRKTTIVSVAELAVVNPDACAVCMENHRKGDEVVTNCGHRFGSVCFAQWETEQLRRNKVTCPCCRVGVTELVGFRRQAMVQK